MKEARAYPPRPETTTTGVLDELERKMYAHFSKDPSEDRLLNSQEEPREDHPRGKSTFKLFTKPNPMTLQQLEKPTPAKQPQAQESRKESREGKSQMGHLIEEVEAIQMLVRKKLALKEERVAQLGREISMETEEKVHLYRTNCRLEQQLDQLIKETQAQQHKSAQEQALLQQQLARLSAVYEERKKQGKKLKKEEEMLRETLKSSHNHRKGYLEAELRAKSKEKVKKEERQSNQQEEQYLRGLVVELDRLKNMVKQKMRKERSRLKIK